MIIPLPGKTLSEKHRIARRLRLLLPALTETGSRREREEAIRAMPTILTVADALEGGDGEIDVPDDRQVVALVCAGLALATDTECGYQAGDGWRRAALEAVFLGRISGRPGESEKGG